MRVLKPLLLSLAVLATSAGAQSKGFWVYRPSSGGSSYITGIGAVGSSPSANACTVDGSGVFQLQPADATHPGAMPASAYARLANIKSRPSYKPDAWGNGTPSSTATATGTLWLFSVFVDMPSTCTGINYPMGAIIGGNVMVSLYGGSSSGGRYLGTSTWYSPNGSTLIAASSSTAQAGSVNTAQTVSFTSPVDLWGGEQFYLGVEFSGTSGTYMRQNANLLTNSTMYVAHTYGTAASSISGAAQATSFVPILTLLCSQTQLGFP